LGIGFTVKSKSARSLTSKGEQHGGGEHDESLPGVVLRVACALDGLHLPRLLVSARLARVDVVVAGLGVEDVLQLLLHGLGEDDEEEGRHDGASRGEDERDLDQQWLREVVQLVHFSQVALGLGRTVVVPLRATKLHFWLRFG
jgi:hypothetical protein